ncbi:YbaB/EbfC family nucleoid-associated protein [Actinokineospora soli]|uniref:YbaB/EbfC family nucleoid-associated protein n=1 Tax=Actinokineospora soli TaxID=1048753 RepID=A0ABW2TYZ9_9PSEU
MAAEDALNQMMDRFRQQAARASALRENIAQLKGSARNADGSVTVTVAPSGAVLGLNLTPAAVNKSHTQLAQEILATIRAATQQAAQAMEDTVRPALGDEYYQQFQDALRAHSPQVDGLGPTAPPPPSALPQPGAPAAERPAPPRRPAAPADDDDDFGGGSIFGNRS